MNFAKEREFLNGTKMGGSNPFFLIAGPCVIESRDLLERTCDAMQTLCNKLGILFIFKSSYDKANRTSSTSQRGPGLEEGLKELQRIKEKFNVPILTDVHETSQVKAVAQVADVIQIPAFLSRQSDLIVECARTDRWVNVKKGQFLAPADCNFIVEKIRDAGSEKYLITERGSSFGYNNLIFDPRSLAIMHENNIPAVFDATHSTQLPGGGKESGGNRKFTPVLSRAAVAIGLEGLFFEVHPNPPEAWSDSSNQYYLSEAAALIEELYRLDRFVKKERFS